MTKCTTCDNAAVCRGYEWAGEEEWVVVFGCDVCCAHGGEDFACEYLREAAREQGSAQCDPSGVGPASRQGVPDGRP
jgi:hypothetical protein